MFNLSFTSFILRRVITRSEQSACDSESVCSLELAGNISMFLASPTPMLHSLAKATTEFVDNHPDLPISNTTETLTVVIQVS